MSTKSVGAFLFGLHDRVPRKPYVLWGFGLAALKFLIDTAIVYGFTGKTWSPLGYVIPSVILRTEAMGANVRDVPSAVHILLAVAALPFLWIGLSMSVRRAADAGVTPWLGMGFLLPLANYLVIAVLALSPSKETAAWDPLRPTPYRDGGDGTGPASGVALPSGVRSALYGMVACMVVGLAMIWLSVYQIGAYGAALFFLTPLAMGAVSSTLYNLDHTRSVPRTIGVAIAGTALTGSVVLLFAIEGMLCLLMAFPIAAILATIGALLARVIVMNDRIAKANRARTGALLLVLPALAFGEAKLVTPTLHDVTTTIEIAATPEQIWPNVIGFSELPPPPEWFFKLGIAHPVRARIDGHGVGAIRNCEFSTGPFVEPITVWDEPRRLAFDVVKQPPSMQEWSPYGTIDAPHLEGYMVSKGGEFRLVPLPNGHTRLEGTTHYTLAIYPETYWVGYAELLLHAIHYRVLTHIRNLSEAPAPRVAIR
jgi:uncharacterized membrane protein YhaH (DUF805 family)